MVLPARACPAGVEWERSRKPLWRCSEDSNASPPPGPEVALSTSGDQRLNLRDSPSSVEGTAGVGLPRAGTRTWLLGAIVAVLIPVAPGAADSGPRIMHELEATPAQNA